MDIYTFCVQWAANHAGTRPIRVLDYGCGAGQIVKALRERGIDAFGCDVYYDGGDYSSAVDPALLGSAILRMEGGIIPFDAASFDAVINNQVLEHVADLDAVLAEISRVLRPGGTVLSLFPDAGVWREGHCGIPFLHWFPKRSQPRVYYAAALRTCGLGYHKADKTALQWSRDFCDWLDQWTFYRSARAINMSFQTRFGTMLPVEEKFLQFRLGRRAGLARACPVWLQRWIVRKLGGRMFEARKKD